MVCSKNLKEYNWDQVKKAPSGLSLQVTSCLVMARSLNDAVEKWLSEPLDLGQSTGPAVWMGLVTLLVENCSVIYVYLSVVPWPWRVLPAWVFFFFFFFKVKIGLVAEAIPETRSFCDYQQRELLGSQCLPMVSCLSF